LSGEEDRVAIIEINRHPSHKELRVFGAIWLVFFGLLGATVWHKSGSLQTSYWIWGLAAAVALAGFASPAFMRLVYVGMAYLAYPIGLVVSTVLMAVVFFIVLTPLGLIRRLVGGDPMERAFERDRKSYWKPRARVENVERYFRQF
jgi:hypothetical protein